MIIMGNEPKTRDVIITHVRPWNWLDGLGPHEWRVDAAGRWPNLRTADKQEAQRYAEMIIANHGGSIQWIDDHPSIAAAEAKEKEGEPRLERERVFREDLKAKIKARAD